MSVTVDAFYLSEERPDVREFIYKNPDLAFLYYAHAIEHGLVSDEYYIQMGRSLTYVEDEQGARSVTLHDGTSIPAAGEDIKTAMTRITAQDPVAASELMQSITDSLPTDYLKKHPLSAARVSVMQEVLNESDIGAEIDLFEECTFFGFHREPRTTHQGSTVENAAIPDALRKIAVACSGKISNMHTAGSEYIFRLKGDGLNIEQFEKLLVEKDITPHIKFHGDYFSVRFNDPANLLGTEVAEPERRQGGGRS